MNLNFSYLSTISKFLKSLSEKIQKKIKAFKNHTRKYKGFYEKMQLTGIYFCANAVLMYTIKNCLGYFPSIFSYLPFSKEILNSSFLQFLASPEKTFFIYLLILQFIILRPIFGFSILVKYNILLLFLLEMIENVLLSIWDILFSRELDLISPFGVLNQPLSQGFLSLIFCFFFFIYQYLYINSLQQKFPKLPGILQKVTDSVAFWLKLK